ncbi:MAG: PHP domain-containing protein [Actinomycetota bacterium]
MLPADRHVHTEWSWDAPTGSMERTCARAVELGLRSVAFTDHADFTEWTVLTDPANLPAHLRNQVTDGILTAPLLDLDGYRECLQRCREQFPDLKILSGVELSEPHWLPGQNADLLDRGAFDLVICGLHSMRHGPAAVIEVSEAYRDRPGADVMRDYLREAARMIGAWDGFEVLAHIDYPVRTWPGRGRAFSPQDFEDEYRVVLRALASSGRVLEVNTTVPLHCSIVQWWRQEGGTAVSFGSDAHDPLVLARGFTDAAALVEACGFRPGQHRHDFWTRT